MKKESRYPGTITFTGAGTVAFPSYSGHTVNGPLPDIHNQLLRLKLFGSYAIRKNADMGVDFIHERWHTDTGRGPSPTVHHSSTAPTCLPARSLTAPRS